jgi:hypothetical protein
MILHSLLRLDLSANEEAVVRSASPSRLETKKNASTIQGMRFFMREVRVGRVARGES